MRRGATYLSLVTVGLAIGAAAPARAQTPTGFQAYHGQRTAEGADGTSNQPVAYTGPQLALSHSYIGRDAAEPMIAIDRAGAVFFSAGAFDAAVPGLARQELRRSTDGGRTWQAVLAPFGTGEGEVTTLDPFVVGDSASSRIFAVTLLGAGSYLAFTDDSGASWTESALTSPGVNDHQTLQGIRPPENFPPSSDPAFPNYVYYCVNHVSDARCDRSSDGGVTFAPTGGPAYLQSGEGEEGQSPGVCSALHGHIKGDSAGRLFIPAGHCGLATIAISEDAGLTWRRTIVSQKIRAATPHTAVAVDRDDNLYYTWLDPLAKQAYLATSTDHGESWSTPLMISPPGVVEVNFPQIVAGDPGRVALTFPGSTGEIEHADPEYDAAAQRPWFSYVVVSTNALDPDPLFLSNTAGPPGDPVHRGNCGPGRCGGMFDFLDINVSPVDASLWASATDTCTDAVEDNKCVTDWREGRPRDMEGVAIQQVSGPKLVGEGFFGPAPASGVGAPVSRPSAPSARKVRLKCRRVRRSARCVARLARAPGGTVVSLRLYRGPVLVGGGSARLRGGRAVVRLRGRSVKAGRYSVLVTVSRRGAQATRSERRVRLR